MVPEIATTVTTQRLNVRLNIERDYIAHVAYRLTLERIVELARDCPWSFHSPDAATLAEQTLAMFPSEDWEGPDISGPEHR